MPLSLLLDIGSVDVQNASKPRKLRTATPLLQRFLDRNDFIMKPMSCASILIDRSAILTLGAYLLTRA